MLLAATTASVNRVQTVLAAPAPSITVEGMLRECQLGESGLLRYYSFP
jgi:hypothetical protein